MRRFLDPHLHPSGLVDNRAIINAPDTRLPFHDPLPEKMVRKVVAVNCGCMSWSDVYWGLRLPLEHNFDGSAIAPKSLHHSPGRPTTTPAAHPSPRAQTMYHLFYHE